MLPMLARLAVAMAALVAGFAGAAVHDPIDLAAFAAAGDAAAGPASTGGDGPWHDVALRDEPSAPRLYLTGILGESFATLADPVYGADGGGRINGSILTAGGAAGMAFARDDGQWRVEIEGRGRDDLTRTISDGLPPLAAVNLRWAAADGWSATANIWRDWWISDRWALYLGGGVGGGGYRYSLDGALQFVGVDIIDVAGNAQLAAFAWQAGGGAVWELTERVSLDVGYRFFSLGRSDVNYVVSSPLFPAVSVVQSQQFTAGELLFSVRVYEPFRRWR